MFSFVRHTDRATLEACGEARSVLLAQPRAPALQEKAQHRNDKLVASVLLQPKPLKTALTMELHLRGGGVGSGSGSSSGSGSGSGSGPKRLRTDDFVANVQGSMSSTHALDLLQMPLVPTSASRFDHAACFGGSSVVSMREVIAEGTCIPHFRSSVSALVRLNRAEGSGHPRIDGSGVAPEHSDADLLALAAFSSSSELSDGEEEDSRDPADAAIRDEIAQRASAPCGHTPCRFDGACFSRDAAHWLRYAHPRETVKEYCPNLAAGRRCFNKGSVWDDHNKLFSHGPLPSAIQAFLKAAQPHAATSAQDDAPSAGNDTYLVQLQAMTVRELKAEGARLGVDLSGCLEKAELVGALAVSPHAAQQHRQQGHSAAPSPSQSALRPGIHQPASQPAARPPARPPAPQTWAGRPMPSLPDRALASTKLGQRFGANPFSTLDAKQGVWQQRKKEWHALFDSSLGRDDDLLGSGLRKMLPESSKLNGTSVFDPVLMEQLLDWYVPRPLHLSVRHRPVVVIDPFAGGVVRGFVAAAKGLLYIGIDVSTDQVEANRKQVGPEGKWDFAYPPCWILGDGEDIEALVTTELRRRGLEPCADALISCPPYYNLEEYKGGPNDLSGFPSYGAFLAKYQRIVTNAVKLLRPKALSIFVVGNVRDSRTHAMYMLHTDTVAAFKQAGCSVHQDAVLITAIGTGAMRATRTMSAGAKLIPTHQNVVVTVKGSGFTPADARARGVRPNAEGSQSQ
jgi:hypothetical protein